QARQTDVQNKFCQSALVFRQGGSENHRYVLWRGIFLAIEHWGIPQDNSAIGDSGKCEIDIAVVRFRHLGGNTIPSRGSRDQAPIRPSNLKQVFLRWIGGWWLVRLVVLEGSGIGLRVSHQRQRAYGIACESSIERSAKLLSSVKHGHQRKSNREQDLARHDGGNDAPGQRKSFDRRMIRFERSAPGGYHLPSLDASAAAIGRRCIREDTHWPNLFLSPLVARAQDVPMAAYGVDQFHWIRSIQLAPQSRNVHFDDIAEFFPVIVVQVLEKFCFGDHFPGTVRQIFQ